MPELGRLRDTSDALLNIGAAELKLARDSRAGAAPPCWKMALKGLTLDQLRTLLNRGRYKPGRG